MVIERLDLQASVSAGDVKCDEDHFAGHPHPDVGLRLWVYLWDGMDTTKKYVTLNVSD